MPYRTNSSSATQIWDGTSLPASGRAGIAAAIAALAARITGLDRGHVATERELLECLEDDDIDCITLTADITLTANLTISAEKTICFRDFKFIQGGSYTVTYRGACVASRVQVFSEFAAGQIVGDFSGDPIFPEWWGLEDECHDIAINCAAQTNAVGGVYGNTISLAARRYTTSRPINLGGRYVRLIGSGERATEIRASEDWESDTFISSSLWNGGTPTAASHTALIWMGGESPGGSDYFSEVSHLYVNCYEATKAYPSKRVSGISSKGGAQEQCDIHHVVVAYFSGIGIGIEGIGEVNGLTIFKYWIQGSVKEDSYPIYFTNQTAVLAIEDGTIDVTIGKANSASYATGSPVYPAPDLVLTRPIFGMYLSGKHVVVRNAHIEGCVVAIACVEGGGCDGFDISCIDSNHLMDRGMVYLEDPARTDGPAPTLATQADEFLDSCIVLICTAPGGSVGNVKSRVTARMLHSAGWTKFLLRDPAYNVHIDTYGHGAAPNTENATLAEYVRSDMYGLPVGIWSDGGNFTVNLLTDVITTSANHGLTVGQLWYPTTTGVLPTSTPQIVANTGYYVKTTPAADLLTISATAGGSTIDFNTSLGSGTHSWYARQVAGSLYTGVETDKTYFRVVE